MSRMKQSLEFINRYPRLILLMAWPVFTLLVIGGFVAILTLTVPVDPALAVQILLKKLDIMGFLVGGVLVILGLNQLAQSSTFFGKLGLKVGSLVDVSADMDSHEGEGGK